MDDTAYMKMALDLALKGEGYTSPNPMVGAVVVRKDRVVGSGYHRMPGGPHAEVNAIDDAGVQAKGATLYVTLEPCHHTGRTPPCTEKIIAAGINRVVAAMYDPNPNVKGGGSEYLKRRGVQVEMGTCEAEARKLNESFVKYVQTGRPFTIVKCAATLDGQIATRSGDAKWVSGRASRQQVHRIRHAVDGILVGVETVKRDDPSLTTRLETPHGRDPARIILDTHLSLPEEARLLRLASESDTYVITGTSVPDDKKLRIEKTGARVLEASVKNGLIDLDALMTRLGNLGITSLLIEGGSRVIASAFKAGIVDKLIFFFAPKISGGNDGFPICRGTGPETMNEALPVRDIEVRRFEDDVMITGYVAK